MAMRGRFKPRQRGPQIRINHRIRVPEVRVVAEDGSNLGVLSTQDALRRAREAGLDLVEVNPKASPPVCKILDFGKYKYEEKKKQRDAKKRQTVVEIKEVKLRPKTDDHDLEVKVRYCRRFLEAGNKVKVTCRFKGREIVHPEKAVAQHDFVIKNTTDLANVEQRPQMEGRTMAMLLSPKPQVLQRLAQRKSQLAEESAKRREAERLERLADPSLAPSAEDDDDDDDLEEDGDDLDEAAALDDGQDDDDDDESPEES